MFRRDILETGLTLDGVEFIARLEYDGSATEPERLGDFARREVPGSVQLSQGDSSVWFRPAG